MPGWLGVVVLGIIEGVTEFLPVSSTGHLLLVENHHLVPRQSDMFNVVIQSGAALAVLAAFGRRLLDLARHWREPWAQDYLLKLLGAFAVTAAGALLLKKAGFALPTAAAPVAWATLIGGVLILAVERLLRNRALRSEVTWGVALAAGLAQILAAAFPGTSRSAATILAALGLGVARPAATEFSFLLGIPTLLAAGALETAHALRAPAVDGPGWGSVLLGFVVSGVCALLVVRWLLRYVQTHTFVVFGWYRIVLGIVILALGGGRA